MKRRLVGSLKVAHLKVDKCVKPDIKENGVVEFQGSGGNHTISFRNYGYTYVVFIIEIGTADGPDATLKVLKEDKTILTEDGKLKGINIDAIYRLLKYRLKQ